MVDSELIDVSWDVLDIWLWLLLGSILVVVPEPVKEFRGELNSGLELILDPKLLVGMELKELCAVEALDSESAPDSELESS